MVATTTTTTTAAAEVKLFGMWSSPFVRRVEWALRMKGIRYEYVEEDLLSKSPSLLRLNPVQKQVPVLVHDGRAVVESMVIIEYIDETWRHNPILPEDPHQRAVARFWARYAEDKFYDAVKKAFFTVGEEQRRAVEAAVEALRPIEKELKGKRFFGGEAIGYADLVAGWIAHWLGVVEEVMGVMVMDPKEFPWVAAWMERFVEDPVIKGSLPPREVMPAFYRKLRQLGLPSCDGK